MPETKPPTATKKAAPVKKAASSKPPAPVAPPVVEPGPGPAPSPVRPRLITPKRPTAQPRCNVPRCRAEPKTRGLCDPHWATHRGYASPSTKRAETDR